MGKTNLKSTFQKLWPKLPIFSHKWARTSLLPELWMCISRHFLYDFDVRAHQYDQLVETDWMVVKAMIYFLPFSFEASHGQHCVHGPKTTLKLWVHVQAITPNPLVKIVFSKMKGLDPLLKLTWGNPLLKWFIDNPSKSVGYWIMNMTRLLFLVL